MLWLSHLQPARWYFLPIAVVQTTAHWSRGPVGRPPALTASPRYDGVI
jgi:hypothetical protein